MKKLPIKIAAIVPVLLAACLSATPASAASDRASQLMDFAQTQFPQYFPSIQANQGAGAWVYRYYPESGAYLVVDGEKVFVGGSPFGNRMVYVGEITQFLPNSPLATISAKQLAGCPDGVVGAAGNFYQCMSGQLLGTQVFDKSVACSFTIKSDGTIQLASGSTAFAFTPPYGSVVYSKSPSPIFSIAVTSTPGLNVESLKIDAQAKPGEAFFTKGGVLQVSGSSVPSGKSLSCRFDVGGG